MMHLIMITVSLALSHSLFATQTKIASSYTKQQLEETVIAMGKGAELTIEQYAIATSTFLPSLEQDLKDGKLKGPLLHKTKKIIDVAAQTRPKTFLPPAGLAYFLKLQELHHLMTERTTPPTIPQLSFQNWLPHTVVFFTLVIITTYGLDVLKESLW